MRAAAVDPVEMWATQAHDLALTQPETYGRRIVLRALIGSLILHSVTLLGVLAGIAGVATALITGTHWFYLAGLAAFALSGIWFHNLTRSIDVTRGVRVTTATAPALLAVIERVAKEIGAPMPTTVEVVPEFNAWVQVARRPRGQWKISLGLPLMLATEVPDFTAIIGHELGHFVSGTLGARVVWSQQSSWFSTFEMLRGSRWMSVVRELFRDWGERFGAESVAMARRHELTSDQAGAKVAGAEAMARGLIRMALLNRLLWERFWPDIWRRAWHGPPPEDVFSDLGHFLGVLDRADVDRFFRSEISDQTLAFDVHPSLSDRLKGLGQRAVVPPPISRSAAVELLGKSLPELTVQLGRWWISRVRYEWEEETEEAKTLARRLETSAGRHADELGPAEAFEMARALRHSGRLTEALPFYRRGAEFSDGHWRPRLAFGLAMLELGDAKGLTELGLGVSLSQGEPEAIFRAWAAARRFLEARGEALNKNPFTGAYHKLRLRAGRNEALREWGRPAVW
ncbi:MAG: M48 family metallopeptidase [Myxococcaceae bacterium]